uniref:Uncharacterized protein n=1 Tax=Candidatus Kentrum sp. FW TaxID=2126338 RepID=A0A450TZB4_9GAMM|nr:MAG: hypothetical protein BECKFW1821C_GA0114237_107421 [Candidatus Kentron sp. FW]
MLLFYFPGYRFTYMTVEQATVSFRETARFATNSFDSSSVMKISSPIIATAYYGICRNYTENCPLAFNLDGSPKITTDEE